VLQCLEMVAVAWVAIGLLAATLVSSMFYLGSRIDALGTRIDGLESSLNARIDALDSKLGSRIDALSARLDAAFPKPRRLGRTDG
jgi:hypothetical protein